MKKYVFLWGLDTGYNPKNGKFDLPPKPYVICGTDYRKNIDNRLRGYGLYGSAQDIARKEKAFKTSLIGWSVGYDAPKRYDECIILQRF